jgi:hypothetical protein
LVESGTMDRSPRPVISQSFAAFLASLTALVLATPFAGRKDWLGWAASAVVFLAIGTLLWLIVWRVIDSWYMIE